MQSARRAQHILRRYWPLVDREVRGLLACRARIPLYDMIRYHLGHADPTGKRVKASRGKRVRAALCLLTCQAAGGRPEWAAPAGAALELLHSFTLLHDDIADQDEQRRGRPTVWKLWGVAHAITAGDALYALANLALDRLSDTVSPRTIAGVSHDLNDAVLTVCMGQQLDISLEGADATSIGESGYVRMIAWKTGALFGAACSIGARIAGAPRRTVHALREFGEAIGIAYQIRDDILGIWGDPLQLGKPVGGDLRRGKRSLPVVLALSKEGIDVGGGVSRLHARLVRGVQTDRDVHAAMADMARLGIRQECEQMAAAYLHSALDQGLSQAKLAPDGDCDLRALARYCVERNE